MRLILLLLLLLVFIIFEIHHIDAYNNNKKYHNRHCVEWTDHVGNLDQVLTTSSGEKDDERERETICRYVRDGEMRVGLVSGDEMCDAQSVSYQVARIDENCEVWWHHQAHNALPLPLMTTFSLSEDYSICILESTKVGILVGTSEDYGSCRFRDLRGDGSKGDYLLLASYDRRDRYSSDEAAGFEPKNLEETHVLREFYVEELNDLVEKYLTKRDRENLLAVSNTSADVLIQALRDDASTRYLHKFFSEDRFVFDEDLNKMGAHVLRCILSERVIDAIRKEKGYDQHEDYETFIRDGVLMKDFSKMTHATELEDILMMVSGYNRDMITNFTWELRPVFYQEGHDLNQDLHVDTYHQAIKVWLYAEDVHADLGPFTVVRGSHRVNLPKAKFLYRVSTHLSNRGPESYGSFRLIKGDNESDFGFSKREGLVGKKLTLLIADTSALHARGISLPGTVRRTFVLVGKETDGGLKRRNPFKLGRMLLRSSSSSSSSLSSSSDIEEKISNKIQECKVPPDDMFPALQAIPIANELNLNTKRSDLYVPENMNEIVDAIQRGLKTQYLNVNVSLVDCPDLRVWGQAAGGISGNGRLVDIGGEAFMHNSRFNGKGEGSKKISFSIDEIALVSELPNGFVIGAGGACNDALRGHSGEIVHSAIVPKLRGAIQSKALRVGPSGDLITEHYHSYVNGGLGNLYISRGAPGTVIRVRVEGKRRDDEKVSFVQEIRDALKLVEGGIGGGKQIGLGGVFKILRGAGTRLHVQPDTLPSNYFDEKENRVVKPFLHFYDNVEAPMTCVSTLWTGDPTNGALNLRESGEHTHCFSSNGKHGGHYHHDTGSDVSYEAYLSVAEHIYRVQDADEHARNVGNHRLESLRRFGRVI